MSTIREPAVAGMFYPGSPVELSAAVNSMLDEAPEGAQVPKALVVPHAGYIYSGPVAATAYARLRNLVAGSIRRVILLGPVHRVPVRGLALPAATAFATPLGTVPLDLPTMERLATLPQVTVSAPAHAAEHSLEVQLPFLQAVLGDFTLVPLAVGDATVEEVAQVLSHAWGGNETLIVISSDLSHYLPYEQARHTDRDTVQHILHLQADLDHQQACGATPLNGLLALAGRLGLRTELLDLRNSGDTAGDRGRVVGYAAVAFFEVRS